MAVEEVDSRTKWGGEMDQTFEMNGRHYRTGIRTLNLLRDLVPAARESGDATAVVAVMKLGESQGIIIDITDGEDPWEDQDA